MYIKLDELYRYVFENASIVNLKGVPEEKKEIKEKKILETIRNKFDYITSSSQLSSVFRKTLRDLKSSNLEIVLYGNNTDEVGMPVHPFPTDDQIKKQFFLFEKEYGYFLNESKADESYLKLFKACKLIADCVENNNAGQDEVASIHAYKLLVLFGDRLSNVDDYINGYVTTDKPVHDLLVREIPKNNPAINLSAWQKLIKKSKPIITDYFQLAPAIENILGAAPKDLFEAENAVSTLTYKRSNENPELAKLGIEYKLSENDFNKCLNVSPKQKDNLPNVTIDGAIVNEKGYHLVKLPIDDPSAYVLGHITNCCQSIGGHSEQCVIDGITLENNGFYVLLKARNKDISAPPVFKGKIDYDNYEIVGQGYAWLSNHGNLTFDSWENLTPSVTDAIITKMLPEFAKQVTQDEKSKILRLTIGTGGKTPKILLTKRCQPEFMLEGHQYGDSDSQVSLYFNKEKAGKFIKEFEEKLQNTAFGKLCNIHEKGASTFFSNMSSIKDIEYAEAVLGQDNNLEILESALESEYHNLQLSKLLDNPIPHNLFMSSFHLLKAKAYTFNNLKAIKNKADTFQQALESCFLDLEKNNLLTKLNMERIINLNVNPNDFSRAITILNNETILTNENLQSISMTNNMEQMANAFAILHKGGILSDENCKSILKYNERSCEFAAKNFVELHTAKILTDQHRALLLAYEEKYQQEHTSASKNLTRALASLNQTTPRLLNDHTFKELLDACDPSLGEVLTYLSKANNLTETTFQQVLLRAEKDNLALFKLDQIFHGLDQKPGLLNKTISSFFLDMDKQLFDRGRSPIWQLLILSVMTEDKCKALFKYIDLYDSYDDFTMNHKHVLRLLDINVRLYSNTTSALPSNILKLISKRAIDEIDNGAPTDALDNIISLLLKNTQTMSENKDALANSYLDIEKMLRENKHEPKACASNLPSEHGFNDHLYNLIMGNFRSTQNEQVHPPAPITQEVKTISNQTSKFKVTMQEIKDSDIDPHDPQLKNILNKMSERMQYLESANPSSSTCSYLRSEMDCLRTVKETIATSYLDTATIITHFHSYIDYIAENKANYQAFHTILVDALIGEMNTFISSDVLKPNR